jgi:hypothetical protein
MSGDTSAFGFGKFIPGFDFLQGLAQSAGAAANPMGRVPQWVAPTVSVEEVDKRIAELKAVQFWLEQNGRALAATIQALEVQRMTLSTLQGMNVSMSELAKSFHFPGAAAEAAGHKGWPMGEAPAAQADGAGPGAEAATNPQQQTQAALGQAMQWWGALTQQFQQIAAKAMAEPPQTMAAAQKATEMASGFAKAAMDQVVAAAQTASPVKPAAAKKTAAGTRSKPAAAASPAAAKKPARKTTAARKP